MHSLQFFNNISYDRNYLTRQKIKSRFPVRIMLVFLLQIWNAAKPLNPLFSRFKAAFL